MPDTKKGNVDSTRSETFLHIAKVQHYLNVMIAELLLRQRTGKKGSWRKGRFDLRGGLVEFRRIRI